MPNSSPIYNKYLKDIADSKTKTNAFQTSTLIGLFLLKRDWIIL
jgi:hypothetical protein